LLNIFLPQNLSEIRISMDKSGATLDELEQELSHVRKEVYEAQQHKNNVQKEVGFRIIFTSCFAREQIACTVIFTKFESSNPKLEPNHIST